MVARNAEYINIDQSNVVRKRVLETAVDATQTLRFFEKYPKLKSKKVAQMSKIRTVMKKIMGEVKALEQVLPELTEKLEIEPKKKAPKKKVSKPTLTKRESDLDQEIKEIKAKLSNLGV